MTFGDPPYGKSYTAAGRSSTIIRQVPQKCQICKGLRKDKKAECTVCDGKGWLLIWETETSWDNNSTPYSTPYVSPQQPYTPNYSPVPTVIPNQTPTTWPPGNTWCSVVHPSSKVD